MAKSKKVITDVQPPIRYRQGGRQPYWCTLHERSAPDGMCIICVRKGLGGKTNVVIVGSTFAHFGCMGCGENWEDHAPNSRVCPNCKAASVTAGTVECICRHKDCSECPSHERDGKFMAKQRNAAVCSGHCRKYTIVDCEKCGGRFCRRLVDWKKDWRANREQICGRCRKR